MYIFVAMKINTCIFFFICQIKMFTTFSKLQEQSHQEGNGK